MNNSATNYPLVQLRRVDNEHTRWLLPDPMTPFSYLLVTSEPIKAFPAGQTMVTVFVNGIASTSRMITVPRAVGCLPPVAKKLAS